MTKTDGAKEKPARAVRLTSRGERSANWIYLANEEFYFY